MTTPIRPRHPRRSRRLDARFPAEIFLQAFAQWIERNIDK